VGAAAGGQAAGLGLASETGNARTRSSKYGHGKIYLPARNLFADDYFKDHFGLTYEEMDTASERPSPALFSQHGRELFDMIFLARPFQNAGDFGAPDITVSIRWQGIVRSWARDLQTSFPAMPAEVNSFSEMNVAEAAANTELPSSAQRKRKVQFRADWSTNQTG